MNYKESKERMILLMFLSIIVPCFNIKKEYLSQCFRSLEKQSLKNIEVIIIDDGSDYFPEDVLKNLGQIHYSYFKQENQGVSVARNKGIELAIGRYIMFVDPDDVLEEECVEIFYRKICECGDVDIVLARYETIGKKNQNKIAYSSKKIDKYDLIYSVLCHEDIMEGISSGAPWAKIFRREFIEGNNLKFVEGLKKSQDRIFMLFGYQFAKSIACIEEITYLYRCDNNSSICNKYNKNIDYILTQAICEAEMFIDQFYGTDQKIHYGFEQMKLNFLFVVLKLNYLNIENKNLNIKAEVKSLCNFMNDNKISISFGNIYRMKLPYKRKIIVSGLKISITIVIIISKIINRIIYRF